MCGFCVEACPTRALTLTTPTRCRSRRARTPISRRSSCWSRRRRSAPPRAPRRAGAVPLDNVVFWVFAPISIGSGDRDAVQRNAVHAALFLIVNFFTIAVFYLVLGRAVPVRGADHRLRGRDHGAVPVRDHAARRRPPASRSSSGSAASARSASCSASASRSSSSSRSARASGSRRRRPADFDEAANRGREHAGARRGAVPVLLLPVRGDLDPPDHRRGRGDGARRAPAPDAGDRRRAPRRPRGLVEPPAARAAQEPAR